MEGCTISTGEVLEPFSFGVHLWSRVIALELSNFSGNAEKCRLL